ncbi:MAG TPA: DinB family protein [Candidatus Limnocylindrales bacterium]|nr:DinB family protein [Candidatus Limnocylindrales bacterium]
MQALSPASSLLQPPVSLLEKTPAILEALLRDVPADTLEWKPTADRWSISEVLEHLLAIEQLYGDRAKRIVVDNNPTLARYEELDHAQLRKKTARQYLDEFVALRQAHYFFWHGIPSSAGSRTGVHPEMGAVTLLQLLNELANHDLGHLRQIAELYRAKAFYPNAGPFQRYSNPKP